VRVAQRYYFIVCLTVARESDVRFFVAMVHIPIRYIDAFVKRIALSQIFAGKTSGDTVFVVYRASGIKSSRLRALLPYQVQL
jgi:hypothetical protein